MHAGAPSRRLLVQEGVSSAKGSIYQDAGSQNGSRAVGWLIGSLADQKFQLGRL